MKIKLLTILGILSSSLLAQLAPDNSFGNGGISSYDSGNSTLGNTQADYRTSQGLQSDGKVIITGFSYDPSNPYFNLVSVARLTSSGSLDNTFGTNGFFMKSYTSGHDAGTKVLIQPDDKILLLNQVDTSKTKALPNALVVLRLKANGEIDSTFGTNGEVALDVFKPSYTALDPSQSMAIDSAGNIYVAGGVEGNTYLDVGVYKLGPNGAPDNSFGSNGFFSFGFTNNDEPTSIAVQKDGKVIIAGDTYNPSGGGQGSNTLTDIFVARLTKQGKLDSSFATNGIFVSTIGADNDRLEDIKILKDGRILVGGDYQIGPLSNNNFDAFALLLDTTGSGDSNFGTNGISTFSITTNSEDLNAVVTSNNDQDIYLGINENVGGQHTNINLLKIKPNGLIDSSFSQNGLLTIDNLMSESLRDMAFNKDESALYISGITFSCVSCRGIPVTYKYTYQVSSTSIKKTSPFKAFHVESDNTLRLHMPNDFGLAHTIQVFDVQGRIICTKTGLYSKKAVLKLPTNSSGSILFIRVSNNKKSLSSKMFIRSRK